VRFATTDCRHIQRKYKGTPASVMRMLTTVDQNCAYNALPTTMKVAKQLHIPYDPGRLYEPAYNIQTGSWYIGHLLQKFKHQVPIGAGSFNCGPRPVMKWLDQNGAREIDEFVELVPYSQTREYMKKVTENFARYQFLYEGKIYEQPLAIDPRYLDDRLTY